MFPRKPLSSCKVGPYMNTDFDYFCFVFVFVFFRAGGGNVSNLILVSIIPSFAPSSVFLS